MTMLCKLTCVLTVMGGMLGGASGAVAQPLFALLNGYNECSPSVCGVGDLNGFGAAKILFFTATSICFGITISGLTGTPTAAHIQLGASGTNGFIFVILTPPTTGNPGASSGCVSNVSAATISSISSAPTSWYVNLKTINFPNGAIRGQLQR